MWRINDLYAATPAHPAELISVIVLNNLDKVAARAKVLLDANRRSLNEFLDAQTTLDVYRPVHGTIVFPRLRKGSVNDFVKLLRDKYETSVVPGCFFDMPQHFRIGTGGDPEMTRIGLQRLGLALDEYSQSV
jgi:aspartate/methionine/tyrosine aminotransferase